MTVNVTGRDCVLGIDVSRYQPSIDWARVAQCRQFAVIKASGGDGGLYTDPMFAGHRANSAGKLPRGAYHFLGAGNGAAQAAHFVRATNGYEGLELPPVVDVETYGSTGRYRPSAQDVRDFDNELHRQLARRWAGPHGDAVALIVYTGKPLESSLPAQVARLDMWLAAYLNPYYGNPWNGVTNGDTPNVAALGSPNRFIPRPYSEWAAWQFAGGDGGCPGVGNGAANCDQNVLDVRVFNRLMGGSQEVDDLAVQELYDAAKGGPGGTYDDFAASIAGKVGEAIGGHGKAEGQPWATDVSLADIQASIAAGNQLDFNEFTVLMKAIGDVHGFDVTWNQGTPVFTKRP